MLPHAARAWLLLYPERRAARPPPRTCARRSPPSALWQRAPRRARGADRGPSRTTGAGRRGGLRRACSTAAARPRCTCSSTSTAIRATAGRRWSIWRRPTRRPAYLAPRRAARLPAGGAGVRVHAAAARGTRLPGRDGRTSCNAIFSARAAAQPYASVLGALVELAGEKVDGGRGRADEPIDDSWAEPAAFDGCSEGPVAPR